MKKISINTYGVEEDRIYEIISLISAVPQTKTLLSKEEKQIYICRKCDIYDISEKRLINDMIEKTMAEEKNESIFTISDCQKN